MLKELVGTTVLYCLSEADAKEINFRYEMSHMLRKHFRNYVPGNQAHVGNMVCVGEILPMIIIKAWSETCVNGKVLLDGNDDLWITSVELKSEGTLGSWTFKT